MQGLQVVALLGMVVACAYAVFANCCLDQPTYSRTVEVTAGSGGGSCVSHGRLEVTYSFDRVSKSSYVST